MPIINCDIEELAYRTMGLTSDETDKEINDGDIAKALYEKYGIEVDQYCAIVNDLIKFTPVVQSGLGKNLYHAFVDDEKQCCIFKIEAKRQKKEE